MLQESGIVKKDQVFGENIIDINVSSKILQEYVSDW